MGTCTSRRRDGAARRGARARTEVEILSSVAAAATHPAVVEVLRELRPGTHGSVRRLLARLPDPSVEA